MRDVLLIAPPYDYKSKVLTSSVKEYAGLGYLAAALRAENHAVEILDADLAGMDIEETVAAILERPARIVGFTVLQVAAKFVGEIIRRLRAAGVESLITVGGHFPSFDYEELLREWPGLDCVVLCEGEVTLVEMSEAARGGGDWRGLAGIAYRNKEKLAVNPMHPLIENLDALPFQTRDTLSEVLRGGGPAAVITSRGCYGNCSFCSVNAFYRQSAGPKWRGRTPESVVDEIEWLVKTWGAEIFVFNDDNFFGPGRAGKRRAAGIAKAIIRRGLKIQFAVPAAVNDIEPELFGLLKESGLRSVFLGIESMVPTDLKLYNKHTSVEQNEQGMRILDELGIFYQIGFIMFNPNSTLQTVKRNMQYIKDKIIRNPYCGTQIFVSDLRILHGTTLETTFRAEEYVNREYFNYTYRVPDEEVEQLRQLMDGLVHKNTFPLLVQCIEDCMGRSWQRVIRTEIAELQLSAGLQLIDYLENGGFGPREMKAVIRYLNKGSKEIGAKLAQQKDDDDGNDEVRKAV